MIALRVAMKKSFSLVRIIDRRAFDRIRFNVSSAQFSSDRYDEPEPGVVFSEDEGEDDDDEIEPTFDSSKLKIPVVLEAQRIEMYSRWLADDERDTTKIAKDFNMSAERAQAIIFVMSERAKLMEKLKPSKLSVEEKWEEIYNRHVEDPSANSPSALSEEYGISTDRINDILSRMTEHSKRMENVQTAEENMNELLDEYEGRGVDISFREPKRINAKNTFSDLYFPALFGDDDLERNLEYLRRKIEQETKAVPEPTFHSYVNRGKRTPTPLISGVDAAANIDQTQPIHRWKLAFRDLSQDKYQATIIRSRNGRLRLANPLEEALRSWTQHPKPIDMEYNREYIKKFHDPDKDDDSTLQLIANKKLAREKKIESTKQSI